MKAQLLPLDEPVARYGLATGSTVVQLLDDKGNASIIVLRHPFGHEPSLREMDGHWDRDDLTLQEFRAVTIAQGEYESGFALQVARLIERAVNELPEILAENRRLKEALELKQASADATPFARAVLRSIPVYDPDKIPEQPQPKPKNPPPKAQKPKPRKRAKKNEN